MTTPPHPPTLPSPAATPGARRAAIESDAAKVSALLAALRGLTLSALCPAGRAALGDALVALNRASEEAEEQVKRTPRP